MINGVNRSDAFVISQNKIGHYKKLQAITNSKSIHRLQNNKS